MKLAFSLLDTVLIFLSFGAVGMQLDPTISKFPKDERAMFVSAVFFFAGFVYLHWSLWRLLVPRGITDHPCSRFIEWGNRRTGFFRGTIGYGYLMVAAVSLFDWQSPSRHEHPSLATVVWFGATLILIGTAARSREVMLHLARQRAVEAASQDSSAKPVVSSDSPIIHADS